MAPPSLNDGVHLSQLCWACRSTTVPFGKPGLSPVEVPVLSQVEVLRLNQAGLPESSSGQAVYSGSWIITSRLFSPLSLSPSLSLGYDLHSQANFKENQVQSFPISVRPRRYGIRNLHSLLLVLWPLLNCSCHLVFCCIREYTKCISQLSACGGLLRSPRVRTVSSILPPLHLQT
jgi:hypothetical protein